MRTHIFSIELIIVLTHNEIQSKISVGHLFYAETFPLTKRKNSLKMHLTVTGISDFFFPVVNKGITGTFLTNLLSD